MRLRLLLAVGAVVAAAKAVKPLIDEKETLLSRPLKAIKGNRD